MGKKTFMGRVERAEASDYGYRLVKTDPGEFTGNDDSIGIDTSQSGPLDELVGKRVMIEAEWDAMLYPNDITDFTVL